MLWAIDASASPRIPWSDSERSSIFWSGVDAFKQSWHLFHYSAAISVTWTAICRHRNNKLFGGAGITAFYRNPLLHGRPRDYSPAAICSYSSEKSDASHVLHEPGLNKFENRILVTKEHQKYIYFDFCGSTGNKINRNKRRIYIYRTLTLCIMCQIKILYYS